MSTTKRSIRPDDLNQFHFVSEPSISSDGKQVVFTHSKVKSEREYASSIWKFSQTDGALYSIVDGDEIRAFSPVWSRASDRFLYLSQSNEGLLELWVSDATGRERKRIVSLWGQMIASPKWSDDGNYIYFLSDLRSAESLLQQHDNEDDSVKVITRRLYRVDGEGYRHNKRIHVFRITTENENGERRIEPVTSGKFDVEAYDISPDGNTVAFAANTSPEADLENNIDVHVVPSSGQGKVPPKRVLENKGSLVSLAFSPDGKYLAYIADDYRFKFNTPLEVWVANLSTLKTSNLSHGLDRPTRNAVVTDASNDSRSIPPVWSSDSNKVFFVATDRGRCNIYSCDVETKKVTAVTSGGQVVTSFSLAQRDGSLAYVKMDPLHLPELFLLRQGTGPEIEASNFNRDFLSNLELVNPREFTFPARDGAEIHGFFYAPKNSSISSGSPPPCIVQIHGGGGAEGFQFMHEFQCQAGLGFAVLTCNFRGTQGYGENFMKVLTGHYMDKDYSDIIDMVKFATEHKWIDAKRIGVTGGSYGGYLTNWAITHDSELFAAAVTDRSVVNLYSFYGTSDDYRLIEEDVQMSFPWDSPEFYLAQSPIGHTKNALTPPLLIIHSDEDYRCPLEQAEQLYAFLKRQGREVVLVVFPKESHGLSRSGKPRHRIERLLFNLWWFTSHIDAGAKVDPPVPVDAA